MRPYKEVYLYHDSKKERTLIDRYNGTMTDLNELILRVEEIQDAELNEQQLKEIMTDHKKFVIDLKAHIKTTFPHPKAKDSFNLEALGIDYVFLDSITKAINPTSFKYDIKERLFVASGTEVKKLKKTCEVYTKNDNQVKAIKELNKIIEGVNALVDNATVGTHTLHYIRKLSNQLLTFDNGQIKIWYEYLLQIK